MDVLYKQDVTGKRSQGENKQAEGEGKDKKGVGEEEVECNQGLLERVAGKFTF